LQNCIILLLLYQKSTTISDTTTNPPAAIVVDKVIGGRGRGCSNYRSRRRNRDGFRNKIYSNNRGRLYRRRNSRKNSKKNYSRGF
jgi:hypothetical protein